MAKRNYFPACNLSVPALRGIDDLIGTAVDLFMMATASFEWGGDLPDTDDGKLESFWLERYLFDAGIIAAYEDPEIGFAMLPAFQTGALDAYYRPTKYTAVGLGIQRQLDVKDCVLLYNNSARVGSWAMVMDYATRLNEITRTDLRNTKQLSFPFIFGGNEETITSLKAAITNATQDDVFSLFLTNNIAKALKDGIAGITTGVQYLGDNLQNHFVDVFNEAITKLGYDNVPLHKKERLITDEAQSNNAKVMFYRNDRLRARQNNLDKIYEKFGRRITVKWIGGDSNADTTMDGE